MDIKSIIRKKREKKELSKDEIRYFVGKLVKGEITEAQAAAVLSYVYINGLTEDEILHLSVAMAESGDMIDLTDISENIVDKHATGGIGEKATILLMPILAALEIPVAKVSSRGYGVSGGTIDKFESIPGLKTDFSIEEFKQNIKNVGACIMNQGLNFAPAEGKVYKLRNQVACENSLPIIASSLMSLKIATGSNKIVFDITSGKGTYINTPEEAKRLAKLLVRLGKSLGKDVACVITNMNQPIGYSIGHNLEMKETVMALKGIISQDLADVVEALGSTMIALASDNKDVNANVQMIKEMVANQGGDISYIEDPELFEKSTYVMPVLSTESGIVESIDSDIIGSVATYLGARRMKDTGKINRTAGITMNKKTGDTVTVGETLAYLHTEDNTKINGPTQILREAFKLTNKKLNTKSRVLEIIK